MEDSQICLIGFDDSQSSSTIQIVQPQEKQIDLRPYNPDSTQIVQANQLALIENNNEEEMMNDKKMDQSESYMFETQVNLSQISSINKQENDISAGGILTTLFTSFNHQKNELSQLIQLVPKIKKESLVYGQQDILDNFVSCIQEILSKIQNAHDFQIQLKLLCNQICNFHMSINKQLEEMIQAGQYGLKDNFFDIFQKDALIQKINNLLKIIPPEISSLRNQRNEARDITIKMKGIIQIIEDAFETECFNEDDLKLKKLKQFGYNTFENYDSFKDKQKELFEYISKLIEYYNTFYSYLSSNIYQINLLDTPLQAINQEIMQTNGQQKNVPVWPRQNEIKNRLEKSYKSKQNPAKSTKFIDQIINYSDESLLPKINHTKEDDNFNFTHKEYLTVDLLDYLMHNLGSLEKITIINDIFYDEGEVEKQSVKGYSKQLLINKFDNAFKLADLKKEANKIQIKLSKEEYNLDLIKNKKKQKVEKIKSESRQEIDTLNDEFERKRKGLIEKEEIELEKKYLQKVNEIKKSQQENIDKLKLKSKKKEQIKQEDITKLNDQLEQATNDFQQYERTFFLNNSTTLEFLQQIIQCVINTINDLNFNFEQQNRLSLQILKNIQSLCQKGAQISQNFPKFENFQ